MSSPKKTEKAQEQKKFDPWSITGYLLAGMLFYGAVGWFLDHWLKTGTVFTPIGLIFGLAAGMYLTFKRLAVMERQEREAYLAEKQKYLQEPQDQHDPEPPQDPQHDR